jgi:hypothetical protein
VENIMSGIFQGDILIKTAIELGMDDMRKNPWLLDHLLSDLTHIKYVSDKYGKKQVDAFKEWFLNGNVDIYMRGIRDKDRLPCVTISVDASNEKVDMKFMADQSTESTILLPKTVGKTIPYVIQPFTPTGYDQETGAISVDESVNLALIAPGMIVVNPVNGQGFPIEGLEVETILIAAGTAFEASQLGVLPKHIFYKARIEHTFFQETYTVGCYAHGDPQNTIWLHNIVLYSLLRYRESLLEANGFAESVINNAPLMPNSNWTGPGAEDAWMRTITLSGQVENSWVKSPRRFIENVVPTFQIISNLNTPEFVNSTSPQVWTTVEDPEDEES